MTHLVHKTSNVTSKGKGKESPNKGNDHDHELKWKNGVVPQTEANSWGLFANQSRDYDKKMTSLPHKVIAYLNIFAIRYL